MDKSEEMPDKALQPTPPRIGRELPQRGMVRVEPGNGDADERVTRGGEPRQIEIEDVQPYPVPAGSESSSSPRSKSCRTKDGLSVCRQPPEPAVMNPNYAIHGITAVSGLQMASQRWCCR